MEVLYYRDCRSSPKYTLVICCTEGASIFKYEESVSENWELAKKIQGY